MPDASQTQANPPTGAAAAGTAALTIPPEIQQKYPELLELIRGSESMNDEERQYWINILPIMTPEQVQNLKDILTNEKDQLAAIDAKYAKDIDTLGQQKFLEQATMERRERHAQRKKAEQTAKQGEEAATEDLLKKIEGANG
jgi:hypothetical protein